ncbi:hypothetical protein MARINON1_51255 [Marinobacter salarius]|nr:hypothetical protein MBHK15_130355 [Marinobacter salarius]VXB77123.1 hypothetical protein MARINON1_51255 [Marinobacter salarius]
MHSPILIDDRVVNLSFLFGNLVNGTSSRTRLDKAGEGAWSAVIVRIFTDKSVTATLSLV